MMKSHSKNQNSNWISFVVVMGMFSLSPQFSFAEQSVPLNIPGGGAADMLNMTTVPGEVEAPSEDTGVRYSCIDRYGRTLKQGQKGFPECIKESQSQSLKDGKPNPIPQSPAQSATDHTAATQTGPTAPAAARVLGTP